MIAFIVAAGMTPPCQISIIITVYLAKPTPLLTPLASLSILVEMT